MEFIHAFGLRSEPVVVFNSPEKRDSTVALHNQLQGYWVILSVSYTAAAAKSLQLCLTLCDPTDGSPPGSPVPGILQARTLEWVAISFSK